MPAPHPAVCGLPSRIAQDRADSVGTALGQRFHKHGDSLAAADASGGEAVARVAPAQFMEQRQNQSRTGSAQRMPQGNGSAIDIWLVAVEAPFFLARPIFL